MARLQRADLAIYAAAILAVIAPLLLFARRGERAPQPKAARAAPGFVWDAPNALRPPRTLSVPPHAIPVTESPASRPDAQLGFPASAAAGVLEDPQDIGPISEAEEQTPSRELTLRQDGPYQPQIDSQTEQLQRLPPVEAENLPDRSPPPELQQAETEAPRLSNQPSLYGPAPQASPRTAREPAQRVDATLPMSDRATPGNNETLRPVLQQVALLNRQAESLARRGAFYLARNQATQALRMVAQALDQQQGSDEHAASLSRALTALREADDFLPRSADDSVIAVAAIVPAHRTPLLHGKSLEGMSPVAALQHYYTYARQQLALAAGEQPVASHSLFLLGKLQTRLTPGQGAGGNPQQTQLAKGMVFHQAALAVDHRNYLAANELGVILVSFGQLQDARRVLTQSLTLHAHADGWHNLAVVHDRLGETEMAAYARQQSELLADSSSLQPRPKVQWVSPEDFAQNGTSGKPTPQSPAGSSPEANRSADSRSQHKETWISPFGSLKR